MLMVRSSWKEPIYPAEYADKPTTTRYLAKDGRRGMFDDETSDLPAMGNLLKTKTGHYSPEEGFEKKEDVEVDVRGLLALFPQEFKLMVL